MNETLAYILSKFDVRPQPALPVELADMDREGLADLFCDLGFKVGAEVGVEQGKYSEVLCKSIPGLKLYCVDAWARYHGYRDHVDQAKLDGFYRATEDRLRPYEAVLVRAWSADAAKQFKRESLDFVYIDANHRLPWVINDIWLWSDRVRPGGIIAGHDYNEHPQGRYECHVVDAVQAWTRCFRIAPWFVVGEPFVQSNGKRLRRNRSWFWVKE